MRTSCREYLETPVVFRKGTMRLTTGHLTTLLSISSHRITVDSPVQEFFIVESKGYFAWGCMQNFFISEADDCFDRFYPSPPERALEHD